MQECQPYAAIRPGNYLLIGCCGASRHRCRNRHRQIAARARSGSYRKTLHPWTSRVGEHRAARRVPGQVTAKRCPGDRERLAKINHQVNPVEPDDISRRGHDDVDRVAGLSRR